MFAFLPTLISKNDNNDLNTITSELNILLEYIQTKLREKYKEMTTHGGVPGQGEKMDKTMGPICAPPSTGHHGDYGRWKTLPSPPIPMQLIFAMVGPQ